MIDGATEVGKSTIAKNFAQNEYKSYIMLDFSDVSKKFLIYSKILLIEYVFLRLQLETGVTLYEKEFPAS